MAGSIGPIGRDGAMLREIQHVRQVAGESRRRWFVDGGYDLLIWVDEAGVPVGLQLRYATREGRKALTWGPEKGYSHEDVDEGEEHPLSYKRSPVLVADGVPDTVRLIREFGDRAIGLDEDIRRFVISVLEGWRKG